MKTLKLAGLFVLLCLLKPGPANFAYCDDLRETNRIIAEYYRKAMESFYNKEYRTAVGMYREILKMDPLQAQAERLIDVAVQKMSDTVAPKTNELRRFIDAGEYRKAQLAAQELLSLDSANAEWIAINDKLSKIAAFAPRVVGSDRTSKMLRKSVQAYTARKVNPRIAVNGARMAWQLEPRNTANEQLRELMESEFSTYAQAEQILSGITVIDQKLQSALSDIYDAKYDRAIIECNDVLDLEPGNVTAMKRAGSAYYALGSKQKAVEIWKKACAIAPDDPELQKFSKMK
jgi:tetratricopeptide (TPR) repeat protein